MSEKNEGQRKLVNYIISPRAQLLLLIPYAILFTLSIVFVFLIDYGLTKATDVALVDEAMALAQISQAHQILVMTGSVFLFLFAVISFMLWLVYTHRIFGPVFAINRQLDYLVQGKYDERVYLRKGDELGETMAKLNALTDILEKKKS